MKKRLEKSLKIKKRIVSGVEKLDTMCFIVRRFTLFFAEIELYQNNCFLN